jgi:hypothetical protein
MKETINHLLSQIDGRTLSAIFAGVMSAWAAVERRKLRDAIRALLKKLP